jgi:hypothetical protein
MRFLYFLFFIFISYEAFCHATKTIPTAPDCNCSQPLERNYTDQEISQGKWLFLLPTNTIEYCPNMSCAWKINVAYPNYTSYILPTFNINFKPDSNKFLLSECGNNISLFNYTTCYEEDDFCHGAPTQAKELCVFFTSEANDACNNSEIESRCGWAFWLIPDSLIEINFKVR